MKTGEALKETFLKRNRKKDINKKTFWWQTFLTTP